MSEDDWNIGIGEWIRHKALEDDPSLDVQVQEIFPDCEGDQSHPSFLIRDPESGLLECVCSNDFFRTRPKEASDA